jgi:hypothetical protein
LQVIPKYEYNSPFNYLLANALTLLVLVSEIKMGKIDIKKKRIPQKVITQIFNTIGINLQRKTKKPD